MKKFLKKVFITAALFVAFCISSISQDYNMSDEGGSVMFRAKGENQTSYFTKSNILSISTVSSTEVQIQMKEVIPPYYNSKIFTVDYLRWKHDNIAFTSLTGCKEWLLEAFNLSGSTTATYQITSDTVSYADSSYSYIAFDLGDADTMKITGNIGTPIILNGSTATAWDWGLEGQYFKGSVISIGGSINVAGTRKK